MADQPDYYLEVTGVPDHPDPDHPDAQRDRRAARDPNRRWIGVHFQCCDVYARIYRNKQATAYEGRCPRCLAKVRVRIGPDGTADRFFLAY
jgi:hypothetical protein